jgi:transposase
MPPTTKEIRAWFLRHPRYHLHFTPTHSSWLNQVERWSALLSQRQIKRGSHYNVRELESAISELIEVHNEQPKPFVWKKKRRCHSQQHWTVRLPHSRRTRRKQYVRNQ